MRRLILATCAALATLLVGAVFGSAQPVAATVEQPAAVGLLALRHGDLGATNTSRYGVVVMNAWEAGRIPAMRAAHPGVKILVYKDMSSTRSYAVRNGVDDALLPAGMGYAWADRVHPEWFLTDTAGARVEWVGYPGHWWMDVGNTDYIDTWVSNVAAELTSAGWDGVMVDNAMPTPQHYLPAGRTLARYPDATSYRAATDRFLSVAGPRLKAAGLDVIPNLGGNFWDLTTYRRWLGFGTGAMREHYGRWGADGRGQVLTDGNWLHQIEQQEIVQAMGKTFMAVTYAATTDAAFHRYARASFLLAWDGRDSAIVFTPPTAGQDPWTADATTDVGLPTGPRTQVGSAWRRTYSAGIVVVNPSSASTVTVDLGAVYLLPDGSSSSAITLAPASGLVLHTPAAGSTTTTAPPPTTTAPPPTTPTDAGASVTPATEPTVPPNPKTTMSPAHRGRQPWYRLVGAGGASYSFGAPALASVAPSSPVVAAASTADGASGWLATADGEVFALGGAPFLGSLAGRRLAQPIVAMAATESGGGYWLVARDGGVFAFGDAPFLGSTGGMRLSQPIVGAAVTPGGQGYWLVAGDGGVFAFGDAGFLGSTGAMKLNQPVVGMAPTATGFGYWLVARDGGVFAFGDAPFFGSTGAIRLNQPIVGMARSATGAGYTFAAADGGVFAFGDAPFLGSTGGRPLAAPITAMVGP